MKIAVLIASHNRKNGTLSCLEHLFDNALPPHAELRVFLVDDGSTDGTGLAVSKMYPQVTIVQGSGDLYWSGGMRVAWEVAAAEDFDYYIWLNDDTYIYRNALLALFEAANLTNSSAIICGTLVSKVSGKITYGGRRHRAVGFIAPEENIASCDIINGNLVVIPRHVFNEVGNIDKAFRHAIGDWDYGLRAISSGLKCYVAPTALGTCEVNPTLPKWCLPDVPLRERIKSLYSPLANAQPIPYFIYISRHFGYFSAARQFLSMHIRVLFPGIWSHRSG